MYSYLDNNFNVQTFLDQLSMLIKVDRVEHINALLTNIMLECKTAIDGAVKAPTSFSHYC